VIVRGRHLHQIGRGRAQPPQPPQHAEKLAAREALRLPAVVAALSSEDAEEGVRAFREKRAPKWSGR
jgi:enoyl-CoA hydratase/carnithine racemase